MGARKTPNGPPGSTTFLACLALILAAVFALSVSGRFAAGLPILTACFLAGGLAWLLAVVLARRGAGDFRAVVAGALALRVLAWTADTGLSDDAYRYLWEGEVVLAGGNPYTRAPEDPELRAVRDRVPELWARVNHKEVRAAYPPVAQIVGVGVAWLCRNLRLVPETDGVRILRAFFGLADLAVLWPLSILLRRARLPTSLAVVWGWSPLVVFEFSGSGHLDSLGILLLIAALAARRTVSVALLCAGILTKYLPVLALPWVLRREETKRSLAVVLVCATAALSFLLLRMGSGSSGLAEYAFRWDSGSLLHRWIEAAFDALHARDMTWMDPRRLARAVDGIVWIAVAVIVVRRVQDPVRGTGYLIGAWLVLSPTLHPWYVCWILPFVAMNPTAPWLWLALAAPVLYWPLGGWQREGIWFEPAWSWPFVALPFFALLAHGWLASNRSTSVSDAAR